MNIMRKPLLITYEYPPDIGGVGKYLEQEVFEFDGEADRSVVVMGAKDCEWEKWPRWLPLVWRVMKYFRKSCQEPGLNLPPSEYSGQDLNTGGEIRPCDAIWVSHILPIGYIALIYKKLFKIPYRLYLHGLDLVGPKKSKWKTFWVREILDNADEIICNSKATVGLLEYYCPGLIGSRPPSLKFRRASYMSRLDINPLSEINGLQIHYPRAKKVNPEDYKQAGIALRAKYHLENKKILLTISRLVHRKGIDLVMRALPLVWRQISDLVYVIIGDGEERDNLRVIASKCTHEPLGHTRGKLRNSVNDAQSNDDGIASVASRIGGLPRNDTDIVFLGKVSDQEKYGWLYACDCFILTPRNDPDDFEGYGIVYKEAQMFGKPVIGSKIGGVPEAVGDDGALVEAGNIRQIAEAIINTINTNK